MPAFRLPLSGNVTQSINPWTWFFNPVGSRVGPVNAAIDALKAMVEQIAAVKARTWLKSPGANQSSSTDTDRFRSRQQPFGPGGGHWALCPFFGHWHGYSGRLP